ncbi:thiamine-phosphate kinase [Rhodopseudomonas thermotolerans]|uniref:Thiamine-monophosphate kinase n=2 Tax=Rhodopseudomonas TaxID=1073 RepID=A0A336JID2_9BRAD|nr:MULTISPECIES: thiamine-phosphate kinase [Rhodopseudomonas]RED42521.1 thiamine-phosphate kinase [Rhodopseudomonas pentothenatexigens]REG08311.1 thiamine-phosphate kinase [Rhodopseudomonas thermotolerans]SSW89122.1 thiamine-phosphate kinase [Rhodopseudomonas pentothenatexigens]
MPSGEDDLIARYFKPLATDPGARGLVDDAAVLAATGSDLVLTTDAIVEGVHYLPDDPPEAIARKALRVNLSDLAAKGAEPAGFLLTLALRQADERFLAPFAAALGEDAAAFRCPLLGGDTVSTPGPMMISVTALGRVPPGRMVPRDGLRPGDRIVVTGTIGDAALGLDLLQRKATAASDSDRAFLIDRYRHPQPRLALASAVRDHAGAAMDISDGLAGDLAKMCAASGVTATLEADAVPLSDAARAMVGTDAARLGRVLGGGDDYELLCGVAQSEIDQFLAAAQRSRVQVTVIGVAQQGTAAPRWLDADARDISLNKLSFSHF